MHFHRDRGHGHGRPSDITPRSVYDGRHDLLRLIGSDAANATLAA